MLSSTKLSLLSMDSICNLLVPSALRIDDISLCKNPLFCIGVKDRYTMREFASSKESLHACISCLDLSSDKLASVATAREIDAPFPTNKAKCAHFFAKSKAPIIEVAQRRRTRRPRRCSATFCRRRSRHLMLDSIQEMYLPMIQWSKKKASRRRSPKHEPSCSIIMRSRRLIRVTRARHLAKKYKCKHRCLFSFSRSAIFGT